MNKINEYVIFSRIHYAIQLDLRKYIEVKYTEDYENYVIGIVVQMLRHTYDLRFIIEKFQ